MRIKNVVGSPLRVIERDRAWRVFSMLKISVARSRWLMIVVAAYRGPGWSGGSGGSVSYRHGARAHRRGLVTKILKQDGPRWRHGDTRGGSVVLAWRDLLARSSILTRFEGGGTVAWCDIGRTWSSRERAADAQSVVGAQESISGTRKLAGKKLV